MSLMDKIKCVERLLPNRDNTVTIKQKWSMVAVIRDKDGNIKDTREVNL